MVWKRLPRWLSFDLQAVMLWSAPRPLQAAVCVTEHALWRSGSLLCPLELYKQSRAVESTWKEKNLSVLLLSLGSLQLRRYFRKANHLSMIQGGFVDCYYGECSHYSRGIFFCVYDAGSPKRINIQT